MRARRPAVVLALGVLPFALGACSGGGGSGGTGLSVDGSTVVSAYPSAADQLEFFDALEARDRVSFDDAIHAALLLEQEDSQTDWAKRVAVARQNGLVPGDFDRPAHGAISTGEAADLVLRAMLSRAGGTRIGEATPAAAMKEFQGAGVLAPSAGPRDAITGREFVSLLTGAREMIGLAPAREPTVLATSAPRAASGEAESFDEPAAASATPADSGATRELSSLPPPKPTNEPLVAPGEASKGAPPAAAAGKPAAATAPTPAPAPKSEPAPKAEPAKDKRWVPGKPVKPPATPSPKTGG